MSAALHQFRVTKYNPSKRNSLGVYPIDDWISYSDIGKSFNGVLLTEEKYQSVERSYVEVALSYLLEAKVSSVKVVGLENKRKSKSVPRDGDEIPIDNLALILKDLLQERYWCRLECEGAFLHIGYDYYMYVGVSVLCPNAEFAAHERGLFVESFMSPYCRTRNSIAATSAPTN